MRAFSFDHLVGGWRGDRRSDYRTNSSFDEIAASHCLPQGRDYAD
jgi:hypothetical protein